jgi:hypothetical protein
MSDFLKLFGEDEEGPEPSAKTLALCLMHVSQGLMGTLPENPGSQARRMIRVTTEHLQASSCAPISEIFCSTHFVNKRLHQ